MIGARGVEAVRREREIEGRTREAQAAAREGHPERLQVGAHLLHREVGEQRRQRFLHVPGLGRRDHDDRITLRRQGEPRETRHRGARRVDVGDQRNARRRLQRGDRGRDRTRGVDLLESRRPEARRPRRGRAAASASRARRAAARSSSRSGPAQRSASMSSRTATSRRMVASVFDSRAVLRLAGERARAASWRRAARSARPRSRRSRMVSTRADALHQGRGRLLPDARARRGCRRSRPP